MIGRSDNVFIVHDAYSSYSQHWLPWLKNTLTQEGYTVFVPKFPTPTGQTLSNWNVVIDHYRDQITEGSTFIGHGLGCAFILRLLESLDHPVRDVYLIAPYVNPVGHAGFDRLSSTFLENPFDWKTISEHYRSLHVFYSDNDPYVDSSLSTVLRDFIPVSLHEVRDAGHFTDAFNITEFPLLLSTLQEQDSYVPPTPEEELMEEFEKAGIEFNPAQDMKPQASPDASLPAKSLSTGTSTFYTDMSTAINQSSAKEMASILRKERTKEEDKQRERRIFRNNILFLLGTVLLVGLGIYALQNRHDDPIVVETIQDQFVPSFLDPTLQTGINIANASIFQISDTLFTQAESISFNPGTIHDMILLEQTDTVQRFLTARDFLELIDAQVSSLFYQDLLDDYMYGFYHKNDSYQPFLILSTSSYGRASDGMLAWEPTMAEDLQFVFNFDPSLLRPDLFTESFEEAFIDNRSYRILSSQPLVEGEETVVIRETPNADQLSDFVQPTYRLRTESITRVQEGPPEEVLVYTFATENLVVISTTRAVVDDIILRLQTSELFR